MTTPKTPQPTVKVMDMAALVRAAEGNRAAVYVTYRTSGRTFTKRDAPTQESS